MFNLKENHSGFLDVKNERTRKEYKKTDLSLETMLDLVRDPFNDLERRGTKVKDILQILSMGNLKDTLYLLYHTPLTGLASSMKSIPSIVILILFCRYVYSFWDTDLVFLGSVLPDSCSHPLCASPSTSTSTAPR